jgi:hypothetical protein
MIAILVLALALAPSPPEPAATARLGAENTRSLSPQDVLALVERTIANQHRNDAALEEYERLEHRLARKSAKDDSITEDRTFRVVPTGTGTLRLLVEENGRRINPGFYRKQLRDLEQALVWALDPNEPRQKRRVEKWAKHSRERAELVDAVAQAFRFTWLGSEASDTRIVVKVGLDSQPGFKPRSRNTELLWHVRATLWIDESAAQLTRLEAAIIRDISFGGGVAGKVYRGGRFALEQTEVAQGIWLPSRYQIDFEGRKFLFGFEVHEVIEVRGYRLIGPPSQALGLVRRELINAPLANPAR